MVKQDRYYEVDRYLPHAILATAAVVLIPAIAVVTLLIALDGELAPLLAAVVGAALALIVAGIGSVLWSHSAGSLDMAFSELLIWGWVRRKRAEESATRSAHLLGLDNDGRPANRARSARSQQLTILGDLSSALESKDPYTHGHSQRVERHSVRTAIELGLSLEQVAEIRRAAALHDVGKIRVPHRILRKPGTLTPEERKIIEQHTVVGAWLVSNVCKREVVLAVRHHHERWDGLGYPDGLSGENIPLYARIIAVSDAFDAMTSSRPYRLAYDSRTAIEVIEAEAGAQFDPAVVKAFIETVPHKVPIAAIVPFFGAGVARKLLGGARRAINGTAMTGAAAAGAASILIAAMLTPVEVPFNQPDTERSVPPAVSGPVTPDGVLVDATIDDPSLDVAKTIAKNEPKRDAKKSRGREAHRKTTKKAPTRSTGRSETVVLSGTVTRDSDGSVSKQGSTKVSEPQPSGSGGESSSGHTPPGDPQPDHGNDCPPKPGKKSPGRIKHCG